MSDDAPTFNAEVSFNCPYCGVRAHAGKTEAGEDAVAHSMPYCKEFDALDALDYITAVRKHYQGALN